jgi:hypothetical protein
MLEFQIEELVNQSCEEVALKIENAGGRFRVHLVVHDLYEASSKEELARNWLKIWYTGERLADSALTAKCEYWEGELGTGHFVFELCADDAEEVSEALLNFTSAYDEDDLEATTFIHDEADEWLEKRGDVPAWFPNLERHYREDAEMLAEWSKDHPDEGDE